MSPEDWIELGNGCLCCSVKSDFVRALEGLLEKKAKFDYVLIETTGEQQNLLHQLLYTCASSHSIFLVSMLPVEGMICKLSVLQPETNMQAYS